MACTDKCIPVTCLLKSGFCFDRPEARAQVMQDYKGWLMQLPTVTPLVFPKMSEFDEKLYPKKS